jgi:hypothetical protein
VPAKAQVTQVGGGGARLHSIGAANHGYCCAWCVCSICARRPSPVHTPFIPRSIECGSRVRSGVEAQGGRLQVGFSTSSSRRTEASLALRLPSASHRYPRRGGLSISVNSEFRVWSSLLKKRTATTANITTKATTTASDGNRSESQCRRRSAAPGDGRVDGASGTLRRWGLIHGLLSKYS